MQQLEPTYLRYIYDGLLKGSIHPENAAELPEGLIGLYEEAFDERTSVVERQKLLERFSIWALLKKEVSAAFVAEVLRETEDDIQEFISTYSAWFNSPESGKYQLYHERLKVYLLQKLSEGEVHRLHEKLLSRLEKAIKEQKADEFEFYGLEFLGGHLGISAMLNGDGKKLIELAYSQTHWQRQLKISKVYTWTKNGLKEVMTWASKYNDDEVIECGLQMVELHHQEQNAAPQIVALVAEGDIDSALKRIEQFGGNDKEGLQRKFILYMLCLMELTLLESKDKQFRKEGIEKLLKHLDEQLPVDHSVLNWNDFFSSYLIFQIACELTELRLDYLIIYKRTNYWERDWLFNQGLFSELQLRQIIELVKLIEDESDRYFALFQVVKELLKQNKLEEALEISNYINDELLKGQTLRFIAIELTKGGKINEALVCLESVKDVKEKSLFYSSFATILANDGNINDAFHYINNIIDEVEKSKALSSISIELTKQGKYIEALECIFNIEYNNVKISAQSSISCELFKLGNFSESKSLINEAIQATKKITDKSSRCALLRQLSNDLHSQGEQYEAELLVQESIQLALTIRINDEFSNDEFQIISQHEISEQLFYNILKSILFDYVIKQDLKQALVCINHLGEKYFNSRTLKEFFLFIKKNDISTDNYIVKAILERIYSLQKSQNDKFCAILLAAQFKLDKTIQFLNSYTVQGKSNNLLEEVLFYVINEGDIFGTSILYLNHISIQKGALIELKKERIMDEIATVFFQKGRINQAIKCTDSMNLKQKEIARKKFSEDFIKQGEFSEALNCARFLNDVNLKFKIFISISNELYKKGRTDEAYNMLLEAEILSNQLSSRSLKYASQKELFHAMLFQGMKEDAYLILQKMLSDTQLINSISERLKIMINLSSMFLDINKHIHYEQLIHEILKISRHLDPMESRSEILFEIALELKEQHKTELSKSILNEAIDCINVISESSEKEFALVNKWFEIAKFGQFEEAINGLNIMIKKAIIDPYRVDCVLYEITKVLLDQNLPSKAIECIGTINSVYWKNVSLTQVSDYFLMNGQIKEALLYTYQNESLREKSTSLSRIAIDYLKKGDQLKSIKISQEISLINERQKCWQTVGQFYEKHYGILKALWHSKQTQYVETKTHYLKGIVNSIGIFDCIKELILSSLSHYINDIESMEVLLQKHALHQLFFQEFSALKLERFNRTLNLQWAIDIKNQLPN
jgi:hypothetical protein